jgi:hypothetical protein
LNLSALTCISHIDHQMRKGCFSKKPQKVFFFKVFQMIQISQTIGQCSEQFLSIIEQFLRLSITLTASKNTKRLASVYFLFFSPLKYCNEGKNNE